MTHYVMWLTVFHTCYIFPISFTSLSSCRLLRLVTLSHVQIPLVVNLSNVKLYYLLCYCGQPINLLVGSAIASIQYVNVKLSSNAARVFSHQFDMKRSVRPRSMTRQSRIKHETWVGKNCTQQLLSDCIGLQDIPSMLSILMPWLTLGSIFQWVPVLLTLCLKILFVRGRAFLTHQCKSEVHRHNKHQMR